MTKKDESQPVGGAEGGRRPAGAPPTERGGEQGRFNSQRKMEAVLRLLKEAFIAAGQAGLTSRQPDIRDEENAQLKALVGDLTLRLEIHRQTEKLRAGELPFVPGKRK